MSRKSYWIVGVFLTLHCAGAALSFAQEPYFRGKTIRIIAGFPPGGGVDIEGRMLARFLPAHIPGNPAIIVQNMHPGGGEILLAFERNETDIYATATLPALRKLRPSRS